METESDLSMERLTQVFAPLRLVKDLFFHLTIVDNGNKKPRYAALWPTPIQAAASVEEAACFVDLERDGFRCQCKAKGKDDSTYFLSIYTAEKGVLICNHPVRIKEGEVLQIFLLDKTYKVKVLGAIRV